MKKIFFFLFFLWITIAIFNIFYNTVRSISEVREWAFLSDSAKRQKAFGDQYDFIIFVNSHTVNNTHILFFSKDDMTYLLSRYYLYPRIVKSTNDKNLFMKLTKSGSYNYLAIYDNSFTLTDYQQIASYSSKTTKNFAYLYKQK